MGDDAARSAESPEELVRFSDDRVIEPCGFEWTNGWGTHVCFLRGEHKDHMCECDFTTPNVVTNREGEK